MLNKILTICLIILMLAFSILWFKKTDLKTIVNPYKKVEDFLSKYGDWYIKNIEFRKIPISAFARSIFRYASLNTINKDFLELLANKNDIYHPYFIINLYKNKNDFDNIPYNKLDGDDKIPMKDRTPIDEYISVMFEKDSVPVLQIIKENELHYYRAEDDNKDISKLQPAHKEFILFKPKNDMNLNLKEFIDLSKKSTGQHFIDYHASEFSCNKFAHCIANDSTDLFTMTYNKTESIRDVYNKYTHDNGDPNPYKYGEILSKSLQDYDEMIHEFTDQKDKVFRSKTLLDKYPFTVSIVNFLTKLLRFKKMLK